MIEYCFHIRFLFDKYDFFKFPNPIVLLFFRINSFSLVSQLLLNRHFQQWKPCSGFVFSTIETLRKIKPLFGSQLNTEISKFNFSDYSDLPTLRICNIMTSNKTYYVADTLCVKFVFAAPPLYNFVIGK